MHACLPLGVGEGMGDEVNVRRFSFKKDYLDNVETERDFSLEPLQPGTCSFSYQHSLFSVDGTGRRAEVKGSSCFDFAEDEDIFFPIDDVYFSAGIRFVIGAQNAASPALQP